ncbi:unnamed protein product, partial [Allacma fusca]
HEPQVEHLTRFNFRTPSFPPVLTITDHRMEPTIDKFTQGLIF